MGLDLFMLRVAFLLMLIAWPVWAEKSDPKAPKVIYWELKPSFVANFGSETGGKLKYMKVDISLRMSNDQAVAAVEANQALVRHAIVMLFSRQTAEDLARPDGQELLRQEALKVAQQAIEKETGAPQIDDLLFTNFITQR